MKYKNIGVILSEFPSLTETFILNQITSLIKLGYEITIISKWKPETEVLHNDILKYKLINKTSYAIDEPLNICKRFLVFIKKILSKLNYKIIFYLIGTNIFNKNLYNLHLFYKYSFIKYLENLNIFIVHFGYNAIEIAKLKQGGFYKDKKLIVFFHGHDLENNEIILNQTRYKEVFQFTDYFVVNTLYLKNLLLKTNSSLENIITLPVGLSLPIKKYNLPKYKKFTIVFCGRLINWKGPDKVVDIANILVNDMHLDIDFKLIGNGEMYQKLSHQINIKKLNKNIELLGALSQEKVFSIYEQSHIFILPGIHDPETGRAETQGLVIQEAQYFELPVLVTDAGGMKYGLIDGETGFVLPQNDNLSFAKKIKELYCNEDLRIKMGKAGNEFVKENYDINKLTKKLLRTISNH